jgi:hypothetical protein
MRIEGDLNVHRLLLLMGLAAALSGPFLRQSEAAEDLVRSLGELGCPPLVEETDGGVGDDSGAAVLSAAKVLLGGARSHREQAPALAVPPFPPVLGWLRVLSPFRPPGGHFLNAQTGSTLLRLRWLQRFLW